MSRADVPGDHVSGTVELKVAGRHLRVHMEVPAGPARPAKLLPLYRSVADSVVDIAVQTAVSQGLTISCTKGCGACCRQLVPISAIEARRLRELVNEMPEPRAKEIRARFAAARDQLAKQGILSKLIDPQLSSDSEIQALGLEYFAEAVACPFLEEESCSIHSERPIACREYLVTSPAEHCSAPTAEKVHCVTMPAKVGRAVRGMGSGSRSAQWVPLIVALEWAEKNTDDTPPRPGPELAREFFMRLTRSDGKRSSEDT